jgi:hypothetical protein
LKSQITKIIFRNFIIKKCPCVTAKATVSQRSTEQSLNGTALYYHGLKMYKIFSKCVICIVISLPGHYVHLIDTNLLLTDLNIIIAAVAKVIDPVN